MADFVSLVGSDGTLVAAAMETAGHYAQSQLLTDFQGDLGQHLGAFLYLIGIIGALITIASGGSYRYGLWLLVGPPLYFFLVVKTAPSNGAEWRFADRTHPQSKVEEAVEGLKGGEGTVGQVSLFFKAWDIIVSETVQSLISITELTKKGSDLDFLNKTDRYLTFFDTRSMDARLVGFIHLGLVNRCSGFVALKKIISDPLASPEEKERAQSVIDKHEGNLPQVFLPDNPELERWFKVVLPGSTKQSYNCQELWDTALQVLEKIEIPQRIEMLCSGGLPEGLTKQQCLERLAWKFGMQVGAGNVVEELTSDPNTQLTMAINELSSRVLFQALMQINPGLAAIQMDDHPGMRTLGTRRYDEGTSQGIRWMAKPDQNQPKGELIIGALTLPYIQGAVLYFLAFTFPFFAISLVLPGRHTGFLLWMGLWLWAKLWDFGFAVVMMVDNMLYALMPHGPQVTDTIQQSPGESIKALLEIDPTYSVHTYYNLVACCLLSVPIITGFLVHKGGNEAIDAVSATYRDYPSKFGNSMAAYNRAFNSQSIFGDQRMREYNRASNSRYATAHANPETRNSYQLGFLASVGETGLKALNFAAPKGFSDMLTKQAPKVASDYYNRIYSTSHKLDMTMSGYKEAKSPLAFEVAGLMVSLNFNSHDGREGYGFPFSLRIDLNNAKNTVSGGGMVDNLLNSLYKSQVKDKPKGK